MLNVDDRSRRAIARYGLSVADVQDVVADGVGGREAGQVFEGDRRFDIVVRLPDAVAPRPRRARATCRSRCRTTRRAAATRAGARRRRHAPRAAARSSRSASVATIEVAEGPNQISRENGKRRVVVQANVRGRDIGSFVAEAQARDRREREAAARQLARLGRAVREPASTRASALHDRRADLLRPDLLLLLYAPSARARTRCWSSPACRSALTGGIVALWLRDMPFSISAAVGFIALSGVAVLNGLVMVTFINQLRARGRWRSRTRSCAARSRGCGPVLMTALVASLGFVPMALATGHRRRGAAAAGDGRHRRARPSTLLTLVVLPALYRIVRGHR